MPRTRQLTDSVPEVLEACMAAPYAAAARRAVMLVTSAVLAPRARLR